MTFNSNNILTKNENLVDQLFNMEMSEIKFCPCHQKNKRLRLKLYQSISATLSKNNEKIMRLLTFTDSRKLAKLSERPP